MVCLIITGTCYMNKSVCKLHTHILLFSSNVGKSQKWPMDANCSNLMVPVCKSINKNNWPFIHDKQKDIRQRCNNFSWYSNRQVSHTELLSILIPRQRTHPTLAEVHREWNHPPQVPHINSTVPSLLGLPLKQKQFTTENQWWYNFWHYIYKNLIQNDVKKNKWIWVMTLKILLKIVD